MRILYVVHQYMPEHVGGTELYTCWLAHALSQRGQQVTIFHRRSAQGVGKEHQTENDVSIRTAWAGLQSPARRFLATFGDPPIVRAFEDVLDSVSPDLIHIQHLMGLPVALAHAICRRRIPYIITLHDYWWICPNAQLITNYSQQTCDGPHAYLNCARCTIARSGRHWLGLALPSLVGLLGWRSHLLRQIMKSADCLIAPTEFVQRWYAAHGAPTDRLATISPGLEYPPTTPLREQASSGSVRFVYIGGLSYQKGVHILIEAFAGIKGSAELWIAGDESSDPDYVARLRALATPNVRFLGKLTRKEVWSTLAQADVVAVPTLWYETFSFIVSEAFAMGIPVVASHLGPLADRVRDGTDGLLLPPGDVVAWQETLQRLIDEPGLRARLRANVAPPMMLEEHVERVESLYIQLVDRNFQA
jgi:glycosyltransferase involved in cell wall biosynthesis